MVVAGVVGGIEVVGKAVEAIEVTEVVAVYTLVMAKVHGLEAVSEYGRYRALCKVSVKLYKEF